MLNATRHSFLHETDGWMEHLSVHTIMSAKADMTAMLSSIVMPNSIVGRLSIRQAWIVGVVTQLFRREALEAKRRGWLGGVSLAQPLRLWVLTLCAAIVSTVVVLFLILGSYTRRSTVTGQLVPSMGLSTVMAPAAGVVSSLYIAEGGRVQAGQTLAVVSVPRATVADGDTLAALKQHLARRRDGLINGQNAQEQLVQARDEGIRAQLDAAHRELQMLEAEVGTRREQIRIAEDTLQRLRQLKDQRYVSLLQIKQEESNALSWQGEMQGLQRQAIAARRSITHLEHALRELPSQAQTTTSSFARDLALLEQESVEIQARGALTINAPIAGVVSAQMVKTGQAVQAGQALLSLLPGNADLEAELLVPSRAIGFVEPGDRVLLRYQAFPYQKFGYHEGSVARISRSVLNPAETSVVADATQAGEPLYRVTVALTKQAVTAYGSEELLKPGMLVEADILGERRRLTEWIFEPLYSLKGKMGGQ